jgi:hypothetical protein
MKTVFLLVGGRIKTAQARIVGKIAEVQTPYGIREFGVWYETHADAKLASDRKVLRKVAEDNAPHEGPARASCAGPLDAVVGRHAKTEER